MYGRGGLSYPPPSSDSRTFSSSSFSSHHFRAPCPRRAGARRATCAGLGLTLRPLLAHQPARGDRRRGDVDRQEARPQSRRTWAFQLGLHGGTVSVSWPLLNPTLRGAGCERNRPRPRCDAAGCRRRRWARRLGQRVVRGDGEDELHLAERAGAALLQRRVSLGAPITRSARPDNSASQQPSRISAESRSRVPAPSR